MISTRIGSCFDAVEIGNEEKLNQLDREINTISDDGKRYFSLKKVNDELTELDSFVIDAIECSLAVNSIVTFYVELIAGLARIVAEQ